MLPRMTLLDGYHPGHTFSEMFDGTAVREHYAQLARRLAELSPDDIDERARLTDSTFRNLGITFAVYGGEEGIERTWPIDLLPRIIAAADHRVIRGFLPGLGSVQRSSAVPKIGGLMTRSSLFVPEGRLIIAQRFIAG